MKDFFLTFREAIKNHILDLEAECDATLTAIQLENDALRSKLMEARRPHCNDTPDSHRSAPRPHDPDWRPSEFADCHAGADEVELIPKGAKASSEENPLISKLCALPELKMTWDPQAPEMPMVPQRADPLQEAADASREVEQFCSSGDFGIGSRCVDEGIVSQCIDTSRSGNSGAGNWGNLMRLLPGRPSSEDVNQATRNWEELARGIMTPPDRRKAPRPHMIDIEDDAKVKVEIRRCWLAPYKAPSRSTEAFPKHSMHSGIQPDRVSESWASTESGLNNMVMRVGILLKNDAVCMQRFTVHPEKETTFSTHMMLVSTCFWSYALVFSFLEGFYTPYGVIEMRPGAIARQYCRSWFVFDFLLNACDWFFFLMIYVQGNVSSRESRLARAAKIRRAFRAGRIIRLAKTVEKNISLLDSVAGSEWIVMCAKILGILLLILTINHYVACLWYGVAEASNMSVTWIRVQNIEDLTIFDKYFYSLHWALTQFTPCTQDIAPANSLERFVASLVALFALVIFSAFMSTLTSAIMQVKKLNFQRYNEQVQIRDFLQRKKVPLSLANRIWHHYRTHYTRRNKLMTVRDINFFETLPKGLLNELRTDIFLPVLVIHPLMKELVLSQSFSLCQEFMACISSITPVGGQDIFIDQEIATTMFFVINGTLSYNFHVSTKRLTKGAIMAEAVMWLQDWQHRGSFTAADNQCELLPLDAASFTEAFEKVKTEHLLHIIRKYASLFAQQMQDNLDMLNIFNTAADHEHLIARCSDLAWEKDELKLLASKAVHIRSSKTMGLQGEEMTALRSNAAASHPLKAFFQKSGTFWSQS